jgi:hypothetical protein
MKRFWIVLVLSLAGLAQAGGADFGFSVRNGPNGNFMGHFGAYFEGYPLDVRTNLLIGAPEGLIVEADLLYSLPRFGFLRPYVGAGLGAGITARGGSNELLISIGQRWYGVLIAGVQFPERGYQPYVEVSQYIGSQFFTRFTVGFIWQVYFR